MKINMKAIETAFSSFKPLLKSNHLFIIPNVLEEFHMFIKLVHSSTGLSLLECCFSLGVSGLWVHALNMTSILLSLFLLCSYSGNNIPRSVSVMELDKLFGCAARLSGCQKILVEANLVDPLQVSIHENTEIMLYNQFVIDFVQ